MAKKKTTEEFKKEVYELVKDEYEVLNEYINSHTHIQMRHNKCGYIYPVTPSKFLSGRRCPNCYGAKKRTTEVFKKEVYNKVGDEYDVLGEYINANTHIEIRHNKCGYVYPVIPNSFLRGNRCSNCSGKKKKVLDDFKKEVYDRVKDEYEVIGEYINSNTCIKMKHNKCGHVYPVRPSSFLRGTRCPECASNKKKTIEEFKAEVYDKVNDEYTVLGEYINAKTYIEMRHNKCGHIYPVTPGDFLAGYRCPECYGTKKKTTEEFKKEVYYKVKDEYEVLGEYINNRTYIEMRHNKCGHVYPVVPNSFLRGRRCPNCFANIKNTTEGFKEDVYSQVEDEYTVLGEYINAKTIIEIQHNACGCIYKVTPDSFLSGSRCPECMRPNYNRDTEKFKKEVYSKVKDEYEVLGEYINSNTYIEMKHNKCDYIYPVRPSAFLRGSRCPKCFGNIKRTTEIFKKEVCDKVGDEYTVLGEYINTNTKIEMKHNKCGYIYPVRPSKFLKGQRCPKCNSSKGELSMARFLDKFRINYEHNKSYGGCSYEGLLKFDFLIFDNNNNLKLICEFDGIQHFEPIDIFGGEKGFVKTQARDKIKNDFCKENSIPLVRIPYWEIDNIHKILGKKLYKLGLIK